MGYTLSFIGEAIVLVRMRLAQQTLQELLTWDIVYSVDFPPKPAFSATQTALTPIDVFPPVQPPPADSVGICVLDSGIAAGHSFLAPAVGEAIAVPTRLGTATDVHGHGTMVAGLALYGDVQSRITARNFQPEHQIFSARVTNERNEFDDFDIVDQQTVEAIEYFHRNYGCRVFNLSLGDSLHPFDGRRVMVLPNV